MGCGFFSFNILVTKISLIETFRKGCAFSTKLMICCKCNSVSDSSTKFTRFGVSSYTCNSDIAVEYIILASTWNEFTYMYHIFVVMFKHICVMRGSIKLCQRGSNFATVLFFFFFLNSIFISVDKER